jgi:Ca2+-dependent lipid-binding protein
VEAEADVVPTGPPPVTNVADATGSTNGWIVPEAFFLNQDDLAQGPKKGRLIIEVIAATNLAKGDLIGQPDPYVEVRVQNTPTPAKPYIWSTRVIDDTLFPAWMQQHTFHVNAQGVAASPVFVLFRVYDHDLLSRDDFLGEACVAAPVGGTTRVVHIEVPLTSGKAKKLCGFLKAMLVWEPLDQDGKVKMVKRGNF